MSKSSIWQVIIPPDFLKHQDDGAGKVIEQQQEDALDCHDETNENDCHVP